MYEGFYVRFIFVFIHFYPLTAHEVCKVDGQNCKVRREKTNKMQQLDVYY
jgi:hypothetical protein